MAERQGLLNGAAGVLGWGWLYVFSALLLCTGFIHTFLLEADHVFLVHAKHLMQKLKRYALLYSMFLSLIKWGALAVLLFPLWLQYGDCTLLGIFRYVLLSVRLPYRDISGAPKHRKTAGGHSGIRRRAG